MSKAAPPLILLVLCFRADAAIEQIGTIETSKYPGMEINPSYNPAVTVRAFVDTATVKRIGGRFKMWDVRFGYVHSTDSAQDSPKMKQAIINCDLLVWAEYGGETEYLINQSRSRAISSIDTERPNWVNVGDKYICDYLEAREHAQKGQSSSIAKAPKAGSAEKNVQLSIPLRQRGGVYEVKATLNSEVKAYFVVDSGASDLTISEDVAKILAGNESLTASDVVGSNTYSFADGGSGSGTVIRIKTFDLGGYVLEDVRAVVLKGRNVPLLLGQSVLRRLRGWSINTKNETLDIGSN